MYRIEYASGARKDLKHLDPLWQKRIILEIEKLAANPFAKGNVKKLVNSPFYRMRVGDYRVVYDLQSNRLVVLVIHVRKREDAYR